MKRLIFVLLLIPSLSYASDWKYLGKNKEGLTIYYDKDSIHHPNKIIEQGWLGSKKAVVNKDVVGVWLKKSSDDPLLIKLHCSTRQYGGTSDFDLENIPPGSLMETLHAIVCK